MINSKDHVTVVVCIKEGMPLSQGQTLFMADRSMTILLTNFQQIDILLTLRNLEKANSVEALSRI